MTATAIARAFVGAAAFSALVLAQGGAARAQVAINEVFYVGNSATADWVELKNVGGSTIDVTNYWLCARFNYRRIGSLTRLDGPSFVIPPGGIITVRSWTDLNGTSSDLGLYSTNSFASAGAMRDFVQWGAAGVGRESVAVAAGLWSSGDFVTGAGAGQSLIWDGTNGGAGSVTLPSNFQNGAPTRGVENAPVAVEARSWSAVKAMYR